MAAAMFDALTGVLPPGLREVQLRRLARQARRSRNWLKEADFRRRVCASRLAQGRDWVQYGHALKQLGFFNAAEHAYRTALKQAPQDAEPHLQLGHLLKLSDRLSEAAAAFRTAGELGYAGQGELEHELDQLARAVSSAVFHERASTDPPSGFHFYLSSPNRAFAENSRSDLSGGLGQSDYSYAFAMRGFIEALDMLALPYTVIQSPEFIVDIRARSDAAINVHLAFYPPERMRLLKGAWNIACFAWEFERLRLPGESTSYHAFADQGTMLRLVDEIWVPSSDGARVVAEATDRPVRYVAAPVLSNHRVQPRRGEVTWRDVDHQARNLAAVTWQPLAILPRIQGTMNEMANQRESRLRTIVRMAGSDVVPQIFVTVLNVHDFRKQLRPLIEGFLNFSDDHPDALLLIKMTTPDRGKLTINEFLLMDQISNAGHLVPPMVSDRIWITDNVLTRQEMNALFDIAEYYVCTPFAEGQNLPLIEAMARGCVPIAPNHTAMADYIDDDNAVVIPSSLVPAEPRITTRYGMWGIRTNVISADAVTDALIAAVEMDPAERNRRSARAAATARERFGIATFEEQLINLQTRLQEMRA